jgi:hypothetical protein
MTTLPLLQRTTDRHDGACELTRHGGHTTRPHDRDDTERFDTRSAQRKRRDQHIELLVLPAEEHDGVSTGERLRRCQCLVR